MKFSESLKKNDDFRTVYKKGKSYANKYLVMYVRKNRTEKNRLGISCSKKVGNSVARHRFARRIREIYRLREEMFNSGLDIVVVARQNVAGASFEAMDKAFVQLSTLHRITVKEPEPLK